MSQRRQTMLTLVRRRPGGATRPRLINRVCVHLVELYFSILQRKVLTPNDLYSIDDLVDRIRAFGERYSALGKLFTWTFTRADLERQLRDPLLKIQQSTTLHRAA
jgi:hypothetical protein